MTLDYISVSDGYSVSKGTFNSTLLVIPSHHSSAPVVEIPKNGFNSLSILVEIIIPYTMKRLDQGSFFDCTSLKKFTVVSRGGLVQIIELGPGAFDGCSSLEEIVIPYSVISIDNRLFKRCPSLKSIKYCGLSSFTSSYDDFWTNSADNVKIYVSTHYPSDVFVGRNVIKDDMICFPDENNVATDCITDSEILSSFNLLCLHFSIFIYFGYTLLS